MDVSVCSVCDSEEISSHLTCKHQFCSSCFSRYLHGSIDELNRCVRCCMCGSITLLTYERKGESLLFRFGRDSKPKIKYATGLTTLRNGDYVFVDPASNRVYILNDNSAVIHDFPYHYKYSVMHGVTVDKKDRIVFPMCYKGGTDPFNPTNYVGLAYYTQKGVSVGFTYMDSSCEIQGLCTTPDNKIVATDSANSKIWFIHELQRVISSKVLEAEIGERESPRPTGITVDKNNIIYLTDSANHCVKVLDKNGELKFKFGCRGERAGEFNSPTGVAVDESGRIIVADKLNHRVQIFNCEGVFERFVVRYNSGDTVYIVPVEVVYIGGGQVAVLLRGEKDANVSEVRIYPCDGHPDILSC